MTTIATKRTGIKLPPWLGKFTRRDERVRAAAGLTPKIDGWYKSIGGRTRYICKPMPVADAVKALEVRQRPIEAVATAGATRRRVTVGTLTLERLVEAFLLDNWERVLTGKPKKLERRTYEDYEEVLTRFCLVVGLDKPAAAVGEDDFTKFIRTISSKAGTTIRREIQYIDRLFNWAGPGPRSRNLIPFAQRGPNWVKPPDHSDEDKAYSFDQLAAALQVAMADPLMHSAWHLGFGSGFIPSDFARLRDEQVNLDAGVIVFPKGRGKTGAARLCPLHPYAVAAMREWLTERDDRPCRDEAVGLFFRTSQGYPLAKWYDGRRRGFEDNHLAKRWSKDVGLPYSGLRSTVATLLDDWPDERAVDVLLGHQGGKKGKHIRTVHYARQFNPERVLRAVHAAYSQVFYGPAPAWEQQPSAPAHRHD